MTVFKIAYFPEISKKSLELIRNSVTPSMVSIDESTNQYAIDSVKEVLLDYNLKEDWDKIKELEVDYIEI